MSEALIFASAIPQYDDILFIELQVHYVKIAGSEYGESILCTQIVFVFVLVFRTTYDTTCSTHVLSLQFSWNELVIQ